MEDENNPWAHCMVMWGNLLYEASQMYAAAGRADWKATLDQAVENFRAAGCPENDIRAALGNHTQVEHLDLPPIKVSAACLPALIVFVDCWDQMTCSTLRRLMHKAWVQ